MSSPTELTIKTLKKEGYTVGIVEKYNSFIKIRQDLYGCIDILACRAGEKDILAVQCTTVSNQSSRMAKAMQEPRLAVWLGSGGRFEVWGWAKKGPRGGRKLWEVTRQEIKAPGPLETNPENFNKPIDVPA